MKKITIIKFADGGQDFSTWEIDSAGKVVNCQPCQFTVWYGAMVTNLDSLKKGSCVAIKILNGSILEVRYPLTSVKRRPSKFVVYRTGKGIIPRTFMTQSGSWGRFNKSQQFDSEESAKARLGTRVGIVEEI